MVQLATNTIIYIASTTFLSFCLAFPFAKGGTKTTLLPFVLMVPAPPVLGTLFYLEDLVDHVELVIYAYCTAFFTVVPFLFKMFGQRVEFLLLYILLPISLTCYLCRTFYFWHDFTDWRKYLMNCTSVALSAGLLIRVWKRRCWGITLKSVLFVDMVSRLWILAFLCWATMFDLIAHGSLDGCIEQVSTILCMLALSKLSGDSVLVRPVYWFTALGLSVNLNDIAWLICIKLGIEDDLDEIIDIEELPGIEFVVPGVLGLALLDVLQAICSPRTEHKKVEFINRQQPLLEEKSPLSPKDVENYGGEDFPDFTSPTGGATQNWSL